MVEKLADFSSTELQQLLDSETKNFIRALNSDAPVNELQKIREQIKAILNVLRSRGLK